MVFDGVSETHFGATVDPRGHPGEDSATMVSRRLDLWEAGDWLALWRLTKAEDAPRKKGTTQSGKGVGPQPNKKIDQRMVDSMRALVAEGAPRKALNLLTSDGLHSAEDPAIFSKLQSLHPPGPPLALSSLPGSVDSLLPPVSDTALWSKLVL